jgi:hypothetical protein
VWNDDDAEEDNHPRNMVCFRDIIVHTLHRVGGGVGCDKTSQSCRKAISRALHVRKNKCKKHKMFNMDMCHKL